MHQYETEGKTATLRELDDKVKQNETFNIKICKGLLFSDYWYSGTVVLKKRPHV